MASNQLLQDPNYDPNGFMDWIREEFGCKSDGQLSRALGNGDTWRPTISRVRNKKQAVSDSLLVKISDYTGMGTGAIKMRMFREAA